MAKDSRVRIQLDFLCATRTEAGENATPLDLEDDEIELLKGLVPRTNNLPLIVTRALGVLQEKEG